jgi:hypothetical protein
VITRVSEESQMGLDDVREKVTVGLGENSCGGGGGVAGGIRMGKAKGFDFG